MDAKKKTITLLVSLLIVGLIGVGGYAYWIDQQFKESEDLAAQEEERIVDPINIAESSDESLITESPENDIDQRSEIVQMEMPEIQQEVVVPPAPKTYSGNWQSHRDYISKGGITIVEQGDEVIIQTSADYSFSGAPDAFLYLSADQNTTKNNAISLGKLQSNNGVQAYRVSKAEFETYNGSVVIWCQAFNLYMGRADIQES